MGSTPPEGPERPRFASDGSPPAASAQVTQAGSSGRVVLDSEGVARASARIAHEIVERNKDLGQIVLVAIARGGIPIGRRIMERIREIGGVPLDLGELDVTLYRDDVVGRGKRPIPRRTAMPQSVAGKRVVLIDDVMFTGRTIRAAMDAVIDFGRPEGIQVACLVDRGHRELPIQVDFVGKNIPTQRSEQVVLVESESGELEVRVE